jgi:hypothetical protein
MMSGVENNSGPKTSGTTAGVFFPLSFFFFPSSFSGVVGCGTPLAGAANSINLMSILVQT